MSTCAAGYADHLDPDVALAFTDNSLTQRERAEVERRIDACVECRAVVVEAARSGQTVPPTVVERPGARRSRPSMELVPGETIGRYVVERRIGEGGMGVVSLARDPELHRAVVIKLVRPDAADPDMEARLRREAQAQAQLSHPNVVQIFDIGRHGDRVFLAMEFVAGQTLDAWLIERERSVDEIVAMFVQCGAGLEAAHRAGLLHRDFKPANVLVDRDGVAKVTDFGLARSIGAASGPAMPRVSGVHAVLTHHDEVIGTPAYMAPEQLAGEPLDARTDQYALALALLDALVGQHAARRTLKPEDLASPTALDAALPKLAPRIRQAIARALRVEPAERFPDLASFVRELRPERKKQRWWPLVAGAALCVAGVAIWFAMRPQETAVACVAEAPRSWQAARPSLQAKLLAKPRLFATWHAEHVLAQIDAAAVDIGAQEVARCEGKQVDAACLVARRKALDAIATLAFDDPAEPLRTLKCTAPPASDDYVRGLDLDDEARAALAAGNFDAAAKAFVAAGSAGERVGDDSIRANALLGLLDVARMRMDHKAARAAVEQLEGMLGKHGNVARDVFVVAIAAASAFTDVGDVDGAFTAIERARTAASNHDETQEAQVAFARALQLLRFEDEAAQQQLAEALAIATSPATRTRALRVAIDLAFRRGDLAGAKTALDEKLKLAPADDVDELTSIRLRAHDGHHADALAELDRLPKTDNTRTSRILMTRAHVHMLAEDYENAEREVNILFSNLDPDLCQDRCKHAGMSTLELNDAWALRCQSRIARREDIACVGSVIELGHPQSPHLARNQLLRAKGGGFLGTLDYVDLIAAEKILVAAKAKPLLVASVQLDIARTTPRDRKKYAAAARPVFAGAGRTAEVAEIDALLAQP